jgi:hypothetical protein
MSWEQIQRRNDVQKSWRGKGERPRIMTVREKGVNIQIVSGNVPILKTVAILKKKDEERRANQSADIARAPQAGESQPDLIITEIGLCLGCCAER